MDRKLLRRVLKAVSGGVRLEILAFLKQHRSANVTAIARGVHRSIPTVSTHLAALLQYDIVCRAQRAQEAYYRLNTALKPPVKQIVAML